jgi:hypothetical protein
MARIELFGIGVLLVAGTAAVLASSPAEKPRALPASLEQIPTGWDPNETTRVRDVTITPRLPDDSKSETGDANALMIRASLPSSSHVVSPIPDQKAEPLCTTFRTYNPDRGTYRAYDGTIRSCIAR